jgi:Acetyltransferase (GNAT) domain
VESLIVPASTWRITEHRGHEGLERLEDDWRRLYAAMSLRTSFHTYEAHLAFVDHLMAAPDRLRCLALSDGHQVRAICLLEANVDRTLGIPVRVWRVPQPSHNPLGDVICPEDDARRAFIPALVTHLRRSPEGRGLLVLGPLREDSVVREGLQRLNSWQRCTNPGQVEHLIDCAQPFGALTSRLSKNFRANLRKARHKLISLADVRFVTATEKEDLADEFEAFVDVEASGWKGETGTRTAIRCRENQPDFFRSLTALHSDDDRCEINALYAEGRCIASQFCMRTGIEYAILKIGYDEGYSRVAPGQLLLERTLEHCCEDPGIEQVSLVSDATWHRDWRPNSVALRQEYVAIGRLSGRVLIPLLRLRFGYARQVVRWLRGQRQHLKRAKHTPRPEQRERPRKR